MSRKQPRWDEGDDECRHRRFVIWGGHVYCGICRGWIGPTVERWNAMSKRPAIPWDYTEQVGLQRHGRLVPVLEDIPLWSDSPSTP